MWGSWGIMEINTNLRNHLAIMDLFGVFGWQEVLQDSPSSSLRILVMQRMLSEV